MKREDLPGSGEDQDARRKKLKEYPLPDEFQEYDDRRRIILIWLVLLVLILAALIVFVMRGV